MDLRWNDLNDATDNGPRFPNREEIEKFFLEKLNEEHSEPGYTLREEEADRVQFMVVDLDTRNDFIDFTRVHCWYREEKYHVQMDETRWMRLEESCGEMKMLAAGWYAAGRPNPIGGGDGGQELGHWGWHELFGVNALVIGEDWTG